MNCKHLNERQLQDLIMKYHDPFEFAAIAMKMMRKGELKPKERGASNTRELLLLHKRLHDRTRKMNDKFVEQFVDFVSPKITFDLWKTTIAPDYPIFKNPSTKELVELFKLKKHGDFDRLANDSDKVCKMLTNNSTGDAFAFPAYVSSHDVVQKQMRVRSAMHGDVYRQGSNYFFHAWDPDYRIEIDKAEPMLRKSMKKMSWLNKVVFQDYDHTWGDKRDPNQNIQGVVIESGPVASNPLREAKEGKNVHLTHIEDLIFIQGTKGAKQAIEINRNLLDMLGGSSTNSMRVTVKLDGAPAVVFGKDPESGKFFVGTKSVFNKRNPKINFTNADIDKNHSGELASKLKTALRELSKLNPKSIYQGDLLFDSKIKKPDNIDGDSVWSFQANTITYAVPKDSDLGRRIGKAKLGIVVHTEYKGKTIADATASFNPNVSTMKSVPEVWLDDATYKDVSGTATFTGKETKEVEKLIAAAESLAKTSSKVLDSVSSDSKLLGLLNQFINGMVKSGALNLSTRAFIDYLNTKGEEEINALKTDAGKATRRKQVDGMVKSITKQKSQWDTAFQLHTTLASIKRMFIEKLQTVQNLRTFIKDQDGFRVTNDEGFVAIDHAENAVKLVDRLSFSADNFNKALKAFER